MGGVTRETSRRANYLKWGYSFFPPKYTKETRCWLDLIENGTFSEETLKLNPINFEISNEWVALIHKSIKNGHSTWLHYLFLGTVDLEKGNAESARILFKKSLSLKSSVHAARNLAILLQQNKKQ